MARGDRLGSIAHQIFSYGDPDVMNNRQRHHEMLAANENMATRGVRASTTLFVGRLSHKADAIRKHLADRNQHRVEEADKLRDQTDLIQRWRELGVRRRLTIWHIPHFSRWLLWLLIAGLDFYIFARAIAYAEGEAASPSNPGFWIGGFLGLIVFFIGLFMARSYRRISYVMAQKGLIKEIEEAREPRPESLRFDHPSYISTVFITIAYILVTVVAALIRYYGTNGSRTDSGLSLISIQTLVPLATVVIELMVDDPTEVRTPKPNLIDWMLGYRLRKLDYQIQIREKASAEREGAVTDRYAFERAALHQLHEGNGMPEPEAGS